MPLKISQIADALQIGRSRIDQWISRGYFRPPSEPVLGKARDWDVSDAMRLAIMAELVDAGINARVAGHLVYQNLYGFNDQPAYFVAWQGAHSMAIYPDGPENPPAKMYIPGEWFSETVRASRLEAFLGNPDVTISIVMSLDSLEQRVKAALQVD